MPELSRFGKKDLKRYLTDFKNWLTGDAARLSLALILVAGVLILILISLGKVHLYGGDIENFSNRLYLLSAIAQSLAAILALVVSLTLIATQLAAQTYSPRVVNLRLRDPWLWGAMGLYLTAIILALVFHGRSMLQQRERPTSWSCSPE